MRLLLVHNFYQSKNIGGEDIVFKQERDELSLKIGKENVFSYEVFNDDITKIKTLLNLLFSFESFFKIFFLIKRNKIQVVHVHNYFPVLTPSCFFAAKLAGAKLVHTLHNYRIWCIAGIFYRSNKGICEDCVTSNLKFQAIKSKCYRKSFIQSFVSQFLFFIYNTFKFFSLVDYFFVLTEFQRKKVIDLGIPPNKIILKPNFVTYDGSTKDYEKNGYIFVGRLEESKGIEEILSIWETLDEKFQLKVIGDGDDRYIKRIRGISNVIYLGKQSHSDVIKHIAASRYLIQSSIWYETFGLTILEAFSQKTPVIGFDIGTRRDFIKDRYNGYLATASNIREVIINSLTTSDYSQLSKNAYLSSLDFKKEKIIEEQISIYGKIIRDKERTIL